jgi:hypothetical protein
MKDKALREMFSRSARWKNRSLGQAKFGFALPFRV